MHIITQIIYSTDTQRPARNPALAQNPIAVGVVTTSTPSVGVFNRFGDDDDTDVSAANAPAVVCYICFFDKTNNFIVLNIFIGFFFL